jgi:hypothetical protein
VNCGARGGFEPSTFRLRGRSYASNRMAPAGFSLLTLHVASVWPGPDRTPRVDWMTMAHSIRRRMLSTPVQPVRSGWRMCWWRSLLHPALAPQRSRRCWPCLNAVMALISPVTARRTAVTANKNRVGVLSASTSPRSDMAVLHEVAWSGLGRARRWRHPCQPMVDRLRITGYALRTVGAGLTVLQ